MARDAIARQYDVDKNAVKLEIGDPVEKGYWPGTITFTPKKGKSLDLAKIHESIKATRLSGSTSMKMDYLEITATGEVAAGGKELVFKVSGAAQRFTLKDDDGKIAKGVVKGLKQLREALEAGKKVTGVTGRVEGWSGLFPQVMKALPGEASKTGPALVVTDFTLAEK